MNRDRYPHMHGVCSRRVGMVKLPPKPQRFEKNDLFKFRRGFAAKVPAEMAKERFGLEPKENIVWLSPDGKSLLTDKQANLNNARRRSSLNIADAWKDLKAFKPEKASELGWNGFQRLMRGIKGSRVAVLQKLETVGVDVKTLEELAQASEGPPGDNTGWGDSG